MDGRTDVRRRLDPHNISIDGDIVPVADRERPDRAGLVAGAIDPSVDEQLALRAVRDLHDHRFVAPGDHAVAPVGERDGDGTAGAVAKSGVGLPGETRELVRPGGLSGWAGRA